MDWPVFQQTTVAEDDTAATVFGTALANPAGANTKGAYTELEAACPVECVCLLVQGNPATNAFMYVDIAVGAAASEQVLVPNLLFTNASRDIAYVIPLRIPKGSRVAARYQHQAGGTAEIRLKLQFVGQTFSSIMPPTRYEDWGAVTADTLGTALTAGAGTAKGSYVQLKAACGLDVKWVFFGWQNTIGTRSLNHDLAIGAAASEQVLLPNLYTPGQDNGYLIGPIPVSIVRGTRISARVASSAAGTTSRVVAYGGG